MIVGNSNMLFMKSKKKSLEFLKFKSKISSAAISLRKKSTISLLGIRISC